MTDITRLRQLAGIQEGAFGTPDAPDWVNDHANMDYITHGTGDGHLEQIMNIWNRWSGNKGAELFADEEGDKFSTLDPEEHEYEAFGYGNEEDAQGNKAFKWVVEVNLQRHSSGKTHLNIGTLWVAAGDYPNSATHMITELVKQNNPDWTSIVIDSESSGGYWPALVKKLGNASLEYDGSGGR